MNKLKAQLVWIPWLNGNPGKKPSLDGKRYAKWSDRSILMTYDQALTLAEKTPGLSGVGFVIPDGYIVIDLDNCIENNIINNQTSTIINKFNSYTEKSPSGTGIHVIVESNLTCKKWTENKDGQSVEYLMPGNFVTFTGDSVLDTDIKEVVIENPHTVKLVRASSQNKPNVGVGVNAGKIRYTSSYGKAALAGECEKIRRAVVGNRTMTLLTAAFKMGQLIPGGSVNEAEAFCNLEAAASLTGLPDYKIRKTIADGIADGKNHPRNNKK